MIRQDITAMFGALMLAVSAIQPATAAPITTTALGKDISLVEPKTELSPAPLESIRIVLTALGKDIS